MTQPPAERIPDVLEPDSAPPTRTRSVGRILAVTAFSLVAGIVVIALVIAGFLVYTVQRSFPTLDGTLALPGLQSPTQVLRDERGVPTVVADSAHDLFFGQGYVHAQDRFWEMDFRRHVTSGRLSELFGPSQVATDTFLRTLGWRRIAEQEVAALDPTTRGYYQAYADGVNAYLADHAGADVSLEYAVLGLQNADYQIEKWTPADSVAWLKAMAWDLRENLDTETERALLARTHTPAEIATLYPQYPFDRNPVIVPTLSAAQPASTRTGTPSASAAATAALTWTRVGSVVDAADALIGGGGEGIGSNSWVISGDLTDTGKPLLANDPHLGTSMPSVWHQIDLKCRTVTSACPFDVSGFGFSGVPGVIIGHNARIAWGFTNLTSDVTDLYVEAVKGDTYLRDGAFVPITVRRDTIKVAGAKSVDIRIRSTVHGPIVSGTSADFDSIAAQPEFGPAVTATTPPVPGTSFAVSLKWTALEPGTTASSIFAIDRARNWADFQGAAKLFQVPAQNLIYADVDGNIGYQTPGKLPIRGAADGAFPQPGWDSRYDWTGYIPFESLPTAFDPRAGYIVTANNAVVAKDYPYFLTNDWDYGWRAARIADLIERKTADGRISASDVRDIQADNQFWMGLRLAAAYRNVRIDDPQTADAIALLRSWNGQNDAASPAAAYANVLWETLVERLFVDRKLPVDGQGRLFLVVDDLLHQPDSAWWDVPALGAHGRDAVLAAVARQARETLTRLQGDNPSRWNWGSLHTLTLRNATFGESGVAPIEWLFNRGPFPVSGGSSIVNATGWVLGEGYQVVTAPSMRMIVDLSDFDASRWNHLTGNSGHAFHPNYYDQTDDWVHVRLGRWPFSLKAVRAAATHALTLTPAQ